MERYEAGELSGTRDAEVLPHQIKITHFCADDADVDAAFDWLNRADARSLELFESSIAVTDGAGKTLHVVVGDGNALCRDYGFSGCGDIDWGRAYQTCRTSEDTGPEPPEDCEELGVTFMDVDPDEAGWEHHPRIRTSSGLHLHIQGLALPHMGRRADRLVAGGDAGVRADEPARVAGSGTSTQ